MSAVRSSASVKAPRSGPVTRVNAPNCSPRAISGKVATAVGRSGASASRACGVVIATTCSAVSSWMTTGRPSRSAVGTGATTNRAAARRSA